MEDEAPDGQPLEAAAEGDVRGPESAWWPWPETEAQPEEVTGPRDGAPGVDETLSLPVAYRSAATPDVPAPAEASSPSPEPEPGVAPEAEVALPVVSPEAEVAALDVDMGDIPLPTTVADVVSPAAVAGAGAGTVMSPGSTELEPPHAGKEKVGSIPAVGATHAWARGQWSNWRLHLVRFVSAGLSVMIAVALVPGLSFTSWRWGQGLEIAVIFALLNVFVKPLLQFVSLRFLFSSYGIVIVLINAALLLLLSWIMDDSLHAKSLLALLVGGALVGLIGAAVDSMLGANYPLLDRDYKERNGLT